MADFCKKCEIEMFGGSLLNLKDDEIILCEGCGGLTPYGEMKCKKCKTVIKSEMYETGLEHYCLCQNTLIAEFNELRWVYLKENNMQYVYQLIQIYNDNGDEFILGTYSSQKIAEKVLEEVKGTQIICEYQIRKERIIK